eukprot:TRINITY_DN9174_c0_g1_i1.p1 TRINITY_DN9174_c0_g1~~TRINITY_DN9174_c0_g1_i1.p1  ORF type:complete len:191 (+),score=44.80 TRINITY_DN9174_c0_g1_i1:47-574(+)
MRFLLAFIVIACFATVLIEGQCVPRSEYVKLPKYNQSYCYPLIEAAKPSFVSLNLVSNLTFFNDTTELRSQCYGQYAIGVTDQLNKQECVNAYLGLCCGLQILYCSDNLSDLIKPKNTICTSVQNSCAFTLYQDVNSGRSLCSNSTLFDVVSSTPKMRASLSFSALLLAIVALFM